MRFRAAVFAGSLLFASTSHAVAQAPPATRGERSILLNASGGLSIGYWTRAGDRTDRGLAISINADRTESETYDRSFATIGVTPALRRYLGSPGPLAAYAHVGVPLSFRWGGGSSEGAADVSDRSYGVGLEAAWGLEWFPVEWASVGGHIGATGGHRWRRTDGGAEPDDESILWASTLNSGVLVRLFF